MSLEKYRKIGAGIIKNPEMYTFYFMHKHLEYAESSSGLLINSEFFAAEIMYSLLWAFKRDMIRTKDMLKLIEWLGMSDGEEETNELYRKMSELQVSLDTILSGSSIEYIIEQAYTLRKSLKKGEMNRFLTKAEQRSLKRSIKKFDKIHRNMNKAAMNDLLQQDVRGKMHELAQKYYPDDDVRVYKSEYEEVLAPYFKNRSAAAILETVLDLPEISSYAYRHAVDDIEFIMTQQSEDREKLQKLKTKYMMLINIAENPESPELLSQNLKLYTEGLV